MMAVKRVGGRERRCWVSYAEIGRVTQIEAGNELPPSRLRTGSRPVTTQR